MDVGGLPIAMRGLRSLTTPLHLISPCMWHCVRPAAAAWRPAHAFHPSLDVRTRCQATAVEEQTVVSQAQSADSANGAILAPVHNADAPTFQEAIARLQGYWSQFGCAICQPHNTEVMHHRKRQLVDALSEPATTACSFWVSRRRGEPGRWERAP